MKQDRIETTTEEYKYRHTKIINVLSAMNFSMQILPKVKRSKVAVNTTFP
jgi:hypothetical protein